MKSPHLSSGQGSSSANPVLVRLWRGGFVESQHRGAWCLVDSAGSLLEGGGELERATFVRSCIKSLQALPLIAGRTHSVGRKPECDLSLKSRSVSGEHAIIEVDHDNRQAVLRDLTSLNGCFINNVRLKVVALRPNSVICELEHQHGVATRHVIYRRPFTIEVGRSGIRAVSLR